MQIFNAKIINLMTLYPNASVQAEQNKFLSEDIAFCQDAFLCTLCEKD